MGRVCHDRNQVGRAATRIVTPDGTRDDGASQGRSEMAARPVVSHVLRRRWPAVDVRLSGGREAAVVPPNVLRRSHLRRSLFVRLSCALLSVLSWALPSRPRRSCERTRLLHLVDDGLGGGSARLAGPGAQPHLYGSIPGGLRTTARVCSAPPNGLRPCPVGGAAPLRTHGPAA